MRNAPGPAAMAEAWGPDNRRCGSGRKEVLAIAGVHEPRAIPNTRNMVRPPTAVGARRNLQSKERFNKLMIKQHSDILIRALRPSRFGASCLRGFILALAAVTVALIGTGLPAQAQLSGPDHNQDEATAPRNLRAQIVDGGVALRWNAPTEDAASVDGYEILRRRPNRGEETPTTLVSDTGNADTAYTDATATKVGVRYAYRVKAIRGGERSAWSDYATVLLVPRRGNLVAQPRPDADGHGDDHPAVRPELQAGQSRPRVRDIERHDRPGRRAV